MTLYNNIDKSAIGMDDIPPVDTLKTNTTNDNVIGKQQLRIIQYRTLNALSEYISNTFGPMGSNTKILKGNNINDISSEYSKDGHNVLKNIMFSNPLEASIREEITDITHHVEHEIGDGTTSAVILSTYVFNRLSHYLDEHPHIKPYQISNAMNEVIGRIQDAIYQKRRDVTIDDIYNICMVSTNSNRDIASNIKTIYENYGMDVKIDIGISTTKNNMIKEYDGVTISEGYSDAAYINNKDKGTAEIHNAKIYAFIDPIDTLDMVSLFEKIVIDNIVNSVNRNESPVPTVIISPKMSRDMSSLMQTVIEIMYKCPDNQKLPLLVITDISGADEGIYLDIAKLCGCKYIKKYIDPKLKEIDEAKGFAANLENIHSFAGECELVVADVSKTKFINPVSMFKKDDTGHITEEYSDMYNALVNFLKSEIRNAEDQGSDIKTIGRLKTRLKSLQANMVEYLIGGITIADRDALKDLVEDAVKNCSSAVSNGIGRAANYEGWKASYEIYESLYTKRNTEWDTLMADVAGAIFMAYDDTVRDLYSTVFDESSLDYCMAYSFDNGYPYDLRKGDKDQVSDTIVTSIETDIKILEAINRLVSIMITTNQCLIQSPNLNIYY